MIRHRSRAFKPAGLESPLFRALPRHALVPREALFLSCTNASQVLCAVRQNSSTRTVLILRGSVVVSRIDDADDPRVFRHNGKDWVLNNNYYRTTMIELRPNGSLGREIRVPITQSKNLCQFRGA